MTNKIFEKLGETQVKARQECMTMTETMERLGELAVIPDQSKITILLESGPLVEGTYVKCDRNGVTIKTSSGNLHKHMYSNISRIN